MLGADPPATAGGTDHATYYLFFYCNLVLGQAARVTKKVEVTAMETKFRPIPITILDIMAILLPGFAWLILIVTAFEITRTLHGTEVPSPILAWERIVLAMKKANTWFAPLTLVMISLLIGYLLKPGAIFITEGMDRHWHKIRFWIKRISAKEADEAKLKKDADESFDKLKFPFNGIYKQDKLYINVREMLTAKVGCSPEEFYSNQIFAVAKRYLRLAAPTLWEESERREAEVRMTAVMFLAFLCSTLLGLFTLSFQLANYLPNREKRMTLGWLMLSLLLSWLTKESLYRLRKREVGYTYLNALIAHHCRDEARQDETDI